MRRKLKTYEMGRLSEKEFQEAKKIPVRVFLDDVRSLLNVGSIFRTCDAFLIDRLYLSGITAAPPNREMEKTALGATRTVHWDVVQDPMEKILELKREGWVICAIEQAHGSVDLNEFKIENGKGYLIILGNEVHGVNEAIMALADVILEIPQAGTKHSLNVSVSAGMVLWEFFKRLK